MEHTEHTTRGSTTGAGSMTEDEVTKSLERVTSSIPSSAYLGIALAAIALSLAAQIGGHGKWGNFVAQWVPTWLIIGLYNKLVKTQGHDRMDRGYSGSAAGG